MADEEEFHATYATDRMPRPRPHIDLAAAPPAWFARAVAVPAEHGDVVVDGARVAWSAWGDRDLPPLVLVHGGAAHAGWWAPLAPLFADGFRVVAPDLTGHGASDHRDVYDAAVWAEELLAAAGAAGGTGRPTLVGHSMGGFVTIAAAAHHGAELDGAVVVDAPVRRPDPETVEGSSGSMFRAPKTYPDVDAALGHFHLVPPQPCENGWYVAHVARGSLREVEGGVTWRFDPGVFTARSGPRHASEFGPLLARAACRVAIVNGADSDIVDADVRAYMAELLADSPAGRAGVPFVEVPEARHHVLLDQPLALVTAVRAVLASWHPVGG
ncbi:MAG: alpha/beta fold hydrolase [Nitriliruptoraceae bacterium]